MASIVSNSTRGAAHDHFAPEAMLDPQEQRKLRGHLEQIDYAAFAANREVIAHTLGGVDIAKFERLAIAAAQARATWVSAAITATDKAHALTSEQIAQLALLRGAYQELTEAYEATRRMVERGYLGYTVAK